MRNKWDETLSHNVASYLIIHSTLEHNWLFFSSMQTYGVPKKVRRKMLSKISVTFRLPFIVLIHQKMSRSMRTSPSSVVFNFLSEMFSIFECKNNENGNYVCLFIVRNFFLLHLFIKWRQIHLACKHLGFFFLSAICEHWKR